MKAVFAALLLLSQLEPLLGAVACLGLASQPAPQECPMAEHGAAPASTIAGPGPAVEGCTFATICSPAPLAIPTLAKGLDSAIPLHPDARIVTAASFQGVPPARPFHPPRA